MPPVVPVLLPVPVLVVAVVAVVTVVVMTVLSVLLIVALGGVVAPRLGRRQFHEARLWKSLVTQSVAVKLGESCVIVARQRAIRVEHAGTEGRLRDERTTWFGGAPKKERARRFLMR